MMPVKSTMRKVPVHLAIIAGCVVMIYPLLWMVGSSFKQDDVIFSDPNLFPTSATFTLGHYAEGWAGISGIPFSRFFTNTFLVVALAIAGNLVTCSMAAYAFARLDFKFKSVLFAVMIGTMMLPYHVVIIPQYIIFNSLGWINTYWPLVVPKFLAMDGFFIFLMVQFIRSLPGELDKAAAIDGCGKYQIYWRIILPLALPALVTTTIFTFIWTWNDFFSQLLYLSDVSRYTISLGLRLFLDSTGASKWGAMFAMSTLSLVPVFFIFVFFQKYLIEGITTGSMKG